MLSRRCSCRGRTRKRTRHRRRRARSPRPSSTLGPSPPTLRPMPRRPSYRPRDSKQEGRPVRRARLVEEAAAAASEGASSPGPARPTLRRLRPLRLPRPPAQRRRQAAQRRRTQPLQQEMSVLATPVRIAADRTSWSRERRAEGGGTTRWRCRRARRFGTRSRTDRAVQARARGPPAASEGPTRQGSARRCRRRPGPDRWPSSR